MRGKTTCMVVTFYFLSFKPKLLERFKIAITLRSLEGATNRQLWLTASHSYETFIPCVTNFKVIIYNSLDY